MRSPAARTALLATLLAVAVLALLALAPPAQAQVDENRTTTIEVGLQADGDARVTVTVRVPIATEVEAAAFDQIAADHTAGREPVPEVSYFRRAAERAAAATDRRMSIVAVERDAERAAGVGRLSVAFTWRNFSTPENGQLAVGDVFRSSGGNWLPGLTASQRLAINLPPSYEVESILIPETRYRYENRTIHVEGPATFEPGAPAIALERTEPPTGPPGTALVAAGAAVLAVVAAVGILFRHRFREAIGWGGPEPEAGEAESVGEPHQTIDPELLSDEERVLRLLERRGGRMKQVDIVEETDWSNAKVSQLLSEMEADDRVEKLRIGRENLISLPGEGPAAGETGPDGPG